jgi:hypothetical protein
VTKFLDTYETWDKIFKIVKDNKDYFRICIHDNCWHSLNMSTIIMDKKELDGLIYFLQSFIDQENI